jgi:hypothetical protein
MNGRKQVAAVLAGLKERIEGNVFEKKKQLVEEVDDE